MDPDAAASGGHSACLRKGEAGRIGDAGHDVVEPCAGEHGDAVPLRLTMCSDGISPAVELVTEQLSECIVGELRLLKADDVGLALVQPRQERGIRCLTEFTFQVAIRTSPR